MQAQSAVIVRRRDAAPSIGQAKGGNSLAVAEKMEVLLANLDGRAAVLRNQNSVANIDTHWEARAILVQATRSNSQDLALVELLDARLGEKDAAGSLGLSLHALDENTVQQRDKGLDGSDSSGLDICSCQRVATSATAAVLVSGTNAMAQDRWCWQNHKEGAMSTNHCGMK